MRKVLVVICFFSMFQFTLLLSATDEYGWISSIEGLRLRAEPNVKSEKIVTIPFSEKVTIIEEQSESTIISNEPGKWVKIKWKDNTGWAFGGFIRKYDFMSLQETVANYFKKKYQEKWSSDLSFAIDDHRPLTRIVPSQIVFKSILQKIYVVRCPSPEPLSPGVSWDHSVWIFKNNKWELIIEYAGKVHLVYLDDDSIPEIISITGSSYVNDTRIYKVKSNKYEEIQLLNLSGLVEVKSLGKCSGNEIYHFPTDADPEKEYVLYKFDCKKSRFEFHSKTYNGFLD